MSLSARILIGHALGIAFGIFFGELVAPIGFVGDAFILLLQMTVLPYVAVSLIARAPRPSSLVPVALAPVLVSSSFLNRVSHVRVVPAGAKNRGDL